jgi:hypothetical protein
VAAPLHDALKKARMGEQKRRLELLLDELARPEARGETLRRLRAVEAAERIETQGARQLLETWAGGAEEARLTREAKAALARRK